MTLWQKIRQHLKKNCVQRWDSIIVPPLFLLWLSAFAAGLIIPVDPYLSRFSSGVCAQDMFSPECLLSDPLELIYNWFMTFISYTPTNMAVLCVCASVIGAAANRNKLVADDTEGPTHDTRNPYASAVMRGFVMFLVIISGLLMLVDDPFAKNAHISQYIRIVGFASLVSFLVSYNPDAFSRIFAKVDHAILKKFNGKSDSHSDKCPTCGQNVKK